MFLEQLKKITKKCLEKRLLFLSLREERKIFKKRVGNLRREKIFDVEKLPLESWKKRTYNF